MRFVVAIISDKCVSGYYVAEILAATNSVGLKSYSLVLSKVIERLELKYHVHTITPICFRFL